MSKYQAADADKIHREPGFFSKEILARKKIIEYTGHYLGPQNLSAIESCISTTIV
jgi:hypothetical protein